MDDIASYDAAAIRDAARRLRREIRSGRWDGWTTGQVPGAVQGNLAILPADLAADFKLFCDRNPKPCPLIAMSQPGDPRVPGLGEDIDIRTDLPRYRVFEKGVEVAEVTDLADWWRDDLVVFVLGCSYSFEDALTRAGLQPRHLENKTKVSIYQTNIATTPAGPFHGPMIVSMRPYTPEDAVRAAQVTGQFPDVHGAPVHIGDPAAIGIDDIDQPISGVPDIRPGETPVFWACGVTPHAVVATVKPPFCITHKAGHMLVTDRCNAEFLTAANS
jgi:uncharacterized protein YcsI (UPF0317 family)